MQPRITIHRPAGRAGPYAPVLQPSVCFIHTPCLELRDDRLEPPLGLLSMATLVRSKGYPTVIIDLSSHTEPELDRQVPDGYDLYGFSTYSVNYGMTRDLAANVRRRNPAALFVAGGPHASALPHQVAADGFDVVVTGQ